MYLHNDFSIFMILLCVCVCKLFKSAWYFVLLVCSKSFFMKQKDNIEIHENTMKIILKLYA